MGGAQVQQPGESGIEAEFVVARSRLSVTAALCTARSTAGTISDSGSDAVVVALNGRSHAFGLGDCHLQFPVGLGFTPQIRVLGAWSRRVSRVYAREKDGRGGEG